MKRPRALQRLCQRMLAAESVDFDDDDSACLVYSKGAGWWNGLNRVHGKTAWEGLSLCLFRADSNNEAGELERYSLNEDGRNFAVDSNYVPRIVKAMKDRDDAEKAEVQDG